MKHSPSRSTEPFSEKDRAIKHNFDFIRNKLQRHRKQMQKEDQEDVAYLINSIESYGFGFFSSHYVYEDLLELFHVSNRITNSKDQIRL